jgi:DNA uptake protein ComE-like DNA-binding protein
MQSEIDSINDQSSGKKFEITPFNPNFITDYKGYLLGLSTEEIDRLHKFRKTNKFVNSAKEFQNVTKVSDSLLHVISPKFKFPDWVTNKRNFQKQNTHQFYEKKTIVKKDINLATKEDLMEVYGIGDKISDIILQERDKFGAFVSIDQLEYVWGITPEALLDIKKMFFVQANVQVKKIAINNFTIKELAKFPYFKYALAKEIVTYRSMNGNIKNIEELAKINNFPIEKIQIIALYLDID